ncbi:HNH endonuclease [Halomonas sp. SSL-5]|uniref:HNH endonuclease n=1 Tax=Halomonas sp. SSL-5 TaxID=3065855 RepID=UPI0027384B7D|nr:HNH endonuclease [Halomonas sp. SSL-5]MDY7116551.1 HNH endonuclease [Halomonas sp. SSL-5]
MTATAERDAITPKRARELLDYDPGTGKLTWLPRSKDSFASKKQWHNWTKRFEGKEAGTVKSSIHCKRYIRRCVVIYGKSFLAHRLAWAIYHGSWPSSCQQIDHINGNALDNRIDNLRLVGQVENSRNQRLRYDNKSGLTGVYWDKRILKWRARIGFSGKLIYLGAFDSLVDAAAARKSQENKLGFHKNHGGKRNEL